MRRIGFILLFAIGVFLHSGVSIAQSLPPGIGIAETAKGKVLTDPNGLTLYLFDKEKSGGEPVCYDKCTELWPPVVAPAGFTGGGDFSVVVRKDGKTQLVHKGWPLYTFHKDTARGQTEGDGFRDVWHVVHP